MPTSRKPPPAQRRSTPELVRAALGVIPPDVDRETWVRVGMAVKASDLPSAVAFELWDEWSARGETYDAAAARSTWRSFKASGGVQVGTLYGIASDHGFRFPDDAGIAVQTPAQRAAEAHDATARRARERQAEEARYRERADRAARDARAMWSDGSAEGASPYLARKGVGAHGVRFLPDGTLLVPLRDAAGELHNLQRIAPEKPVQGPEKRFMSGGRKAGLLHVLGSLQGAPLALMAEGYATAASVHEATGRPVVVAFDAGNLAAVAKALRERWPTLALLVCADDDAATAARTGHNPGHEKAASTVRAVATADAPAGLVLPERAAEAGTARSDSPAAPVNFDFNDMASAAGLDAVRACIEAACAALLAGTLPQPGRRRGAAAEPAPAAGGADGSGDDAASGTAPSAPQGADAFPGRRDPFTVDMRGVWMRGRDREGNDKPPQWLCAPLHVVARTRADDANGWGYLLEFTDPDGNPKTWAMPSAMLSGEGAEWAGRLRDMGLRMAPGSAARNTLAQYIDTRDPQDRVTCTDRVGWHGPVYVLPSGAIASAAVRAEGRRYVFQSEAGMEDTFRRAGELAQWREQVAALAVNNSRLVFALCVAFGGPMLRLAGMESGGFHFRGTSSMGKTTALKVAASVWGRPTYMQRWRSTDNALEATAVQHCDCTLILDEFGQLDPRVAGDVAYMLANDQEKGRNTRGGLNRKRRTWRLLFLSSGEVSLADHMAEAGKRTQAGMEVRMVDVPLDAGAGMGGIEDAHGRESAAELADEIAAHGAKVYGVAGRAWLEWACEHVTELPQRLAKLVDEHRAAMVPEAASEQVRRVGSRFALAAAAGELATEAGITGWAPGHAAWGARQCFNAWLAARGHLDNGEDVAMLRQVRAWIEKNGDALLTWHHRGTDDHKPATPLRAGFKRFVDEQGKAVTVSAATEYVDRRSTPESSERSAALVEYLLLPESFRRDVCKGYDATAVARLLQKRGHLAHDAGRLTTKQRLPGVGHVPCYRVKPSLLAEAVD